ncbi:hypothetical protein [Phyllobacterium sp. P5_D12]
MIQPTKTVTVREFCRAVDISVARLYHLWQASKGPPRIVGAIDGDSRPRVLVPLAAGLQWNVERLSHVHANLLATGDKQKQRAVAERERRARRNQRLQSQLAQSPLYTALTTAQAVESHFNEH